ncbi:MAG: enoyl-CoA hydratase/isomerase family protein [Terriglobia bacterium]
MEPSPARSRSVSLEQENRVARLTIQRPPLNILDIPAIRELRERIGGLWGDRAEYTAVRLVEIRGSGEKAFSAGVEIHDHFPERAPEMLNEFHALIRSVLRAPCPTAAIVRGHCLGGGMELALACDFVLAAEDASFGQPEIRVGAFPPVASVLLPRLIPEKKAVEMILTGEGIGAHEAARLGLVNVVARVDDFDAEVTKFEEKLLARSPAVMALAVRAVRLRRLEGFEAALRETERIYLQELLPTQDATEGLRAFVEKRAPQWEK